MNKFLIAALATVASSPAFAGPGGNITAHAVPEISALEGTAAIAAVAAVLLLVWERSRRAA